MLNSGKPQIVTSLTRFFERMSIRTKTIITFSRLSRLRGRRRLIFFWLLYYRSLEGNLRRSALEISHFALLVTEPISSHFLHVYVSKVFRPIYTLRDGRRSTCVRLSSTPQKYIYRDTERHDIMTIRFSFEVRTSSFMKQRESSVDLLY